MTGAKKISVRTCLVLLPVLVLLLCLVVSQLILTKIKFFPLLAVCAILATISGGAAIFLVTVWAAKKSEVSPPKSGGFRSLAIGIILGLSVSILSGSFYALTKHSNLSHISSSKLVKRSLLSIQSAVFEETSFRGGVVQLVTEYAGPTWGLVSGSLPFSVMHLLNLLVGGKVSMSYFFGLFMAGLLLSLIFLEYGLFAAIGLHWVWNSLAGVWVEALNLQPLGGTVELEGAWTTVAILATFSIPFILLKIKAHRKTSATGT